MYGYNTDYPLARTMYPDVMNASKERFGVFEDFQRDVNNGTLASYVWLEPDLGFGKAANSQHPGTLDVSRGEKFIYDIYRTLHNSPIWNDTLLIFTYDEHGGCYDHVMPPNNAVSPDDYVGKKRNLILVLTDLGYECQLLQFLLEFRLVQYVKLKGIHRLIILQF